MRILIATLIAIPTLCLSQAAENTTPNGGLNGIRSETTTSGAVNGRFSANSITNFDSNSARPNSYALSVAEHVNGGASGQKFAISGASYLKGGSTGQVAIGTYGLAEGIAPVPGASLYGMNAQCVLDKGVTNYTFVNCLEADMNMRPGSQAAARIGIGSSDNGSAAQGSKYDAAFAVYAGDGAVGWKNAYLISNFGGDPAISSQGNVMYIDNALSVANGIDFSKATFTQCAFLSPRYCVNGLGWLGVGTTTPKGLMDVDGGTALTGRGSDISLKAQGGATSNSGGNVAIYAGAEGAGGDPGYILLNTLGHSGDTRVFIDSNSSSSMASVVFRQNGGAKYFFELASGPVPEFFLWDQVSGHGVWAYSSAKDTFTMNSSPVSGGTSFTASGCQVNHAIGGAAAGTFAIGENSCKVTIRINGATGSAAPHGWACPSWDQTHPAVLIGGNISSTNSTATFSIPAGASVNDVIAYSCTGY